MNSVGSGRGEDGFQLCEQFACVDGRPMDGWKIRTRWNNGRVPDEVTYLESATVHHDLPCDQAFLVAGLTDSKCQELYSTILAVSLRLG